MPIVVIIFLLRKKHTQMYYYLSGELLLIVHGAAFMRLKMMNRISTIGKNQRPVLMTLKSFIPQKMFIINCEIVEQPRRYNNNC